MELFYLNKWLSIPTQLCKWHNVILLKCNRFKYRNDTYFICTILWLSLIHCTACKICSINRKYVWLRFQIVDFAWMWCWRCVYKYNYYASLFMNLFSLISNKMTFDLRTIYFLFATKYGCKRRSEMRTCYCHSWYFNIQTIHYCIAYYPYYIKYDLLFSFIC